MISFVLMEVAVSWNSRNTTLATHDKRSNLCATIGAPAGGRTATRCNARRSTTHGLKTVVRVLESVCGLFLHG
jgi:hypothetical protein